jgi:hypothetical protein
MRAVRLLALIAVIVSLLLPGVATARSAPGDAANYDGDASHIGGALLLCGQVTEFTAPDGVATDGAMTMTGVSDPDPHGFVIAATAAVTPADGALLTALAGTDSFTCLDAVGDGMGVLVEIAILPSAQFCGSVDPSGTTWRLTDTEFPDLTTTLSGEAEVILDADVRLDDLLAWFDQFDNESCLTFTTDATGVVTEITLDGELRVCGDVADTSTHPSSAVLEYGGALGDEAIRPDVVGLGGIVLPASLFTDAAIGLLELAYAAQTYPAFDGVASVCALVPVADTELLPASLSPGAVTLCGWYGIGSETIGLTDVANVGWTWFAVLFDGLAGIDARHGVDENLGRAMFLGDPVCLDAVVAGGAADETRQLTAEIAGCAEVVARSDEAITLRMDGSTIGFELTPGSSVDATLVPGITSEIALTAIGAVDGPVTITRTAATCDGSGGGGGGKLPDTATPFPATTAGVAAVLVLGALGLAGCTARVSRARRHI